VLVLGRRPCAGRIAAVGGWSPRALTCARGSRCAAGSGAPASGSPAVRRSSAVAGVRRRVRPPRWRRLVSLAAAESVARRRRACLPVGLRPGVGCPPGGIEHAVRAPAVPAASPRDRRAALRGGVPPGRLACAIVDATACWFAAGSSRPSGAVGLLRQPRLRRDLPTRWTVRRSGGRAAGSSAPGGGGPPAHSRWLIGRAHTGGQRGGARWPAGVDS